MDRSTVGDGRASPDEAPARPSWVRAMAGAEAFRDEQRAMGRHWHYLGLERDIPRTGDWFRTWLGGEPVFVQRFEDGLAAFVNRCAHRFHPIRTADRGTGPVVCPFHEWRYDRTGLAYGIPKCREIYGRSPKELGARLRRVHLATCGGLIFGRLAEEGPELGAWLGPGRAVLEHLGGARLLPVRYDRTVRAHWKLMMHISLDDYHVVGVHPTTFGRHGYLPTRVLRYFRFAPHSAYFAGQDADALDRMAAECSAGTWRPGGYRIFQFFPNLIVVLVDSPPLFGRRRHFLLIQHLVAEAHDRTRTVTRFFSLDRAGGPVARLMEQLFAAGLWLVAGRIHSEDNACVERQQSIAHSVDSDPILSAQEERVRWFEEDYMRLVTDPGN